MPNRNKKTIVLVVWVVVLAVIGYFVAHLSDTPGSSGDPSKPPPSIPVKLTAADATTQWAEIVRHAAAPPRGDANAPYSVVEFGDFQCPQCGKMRPIIESALKDAGSSANLYFVHRPFPTIHKFAIAAASASVVAADEGKFWPMYDELYSHQDDLEPGNYDGYAKDVGVDPKKAASAFQDPGILARVDEATQFCNKIGINETPTMIIRDNRSGKVLSVAGGGDDIKKLLANPPWRGQSATASAK